MLSQFFFFYGFNSLPGLLFVFISPLLCSLHWAPFGPHRWPNTSTVACTCMRYEFTPNAWFSFTSNHLQPNVEQIISWIEQTAGWLMFWRRKVTQSGSVLCIFAFANIVKQCLTIASKDDSSIYFFFFTFAGNMEIIFLWCQSDWHLFFLGTLATHSSRFMCLAGNWKEFQFSLD